MYSIVCLDNLDFRTLILYIRVQPTSAEVIDANNIVYNSLYFRFYNQNILNFPNNIGSSEAVLYTLNFNRYLDSSTRPPEDSSKKRIDYGFQICIVMNTRDSIYFRSFEWSTQRYGRWRKITMTLDEA